MTRRNPKLAFALFTDSDVSGLSRLALTLAPIESLVVWGCVAFQEGDNITAHAGAARHMRSLLRDLGEHPGIRAKSKVSVSSTPSQDLSQVLQQHNIRTLFIDEAGFRTLGPELEDVLAERKVNLCILRGTLPGQPQSMCIPMRGGPQAEFALRMALKLSQATGAEVTTLHAQEKSAPISLVDRFLQGIRRVRLWRVEQDDLIRRITEASRNTDLLIIGAGGRIELTDSAVQYGRFTDEVLSKVSSPTLIIRTRDTYQSSPRLTQQGGHSISVLVDQWFAENTFHAEEFVDLERLCQLKKERGHRIALALPTLNEEKTIGNILDSVQEHLIGKFPFLDELIVMDSGSTDKTRKIAESRGVPTFIHQEILPRYGARKGKGEALWKSLYVTHSDIILWCDTDVSNFQPHFVYALAGPLLTRRDIHFMKGFYRRPLKTGSGLQHGGGGRVTELCARPLLNLFYPELSGVIQPLSGEYGGRRELLESIPFTSGYGVETVSLIGAYEKHGLSAIGQVDLLERVHENQSLTNLSKMSFAIIQTVLACLGRTHGKTLVEDVNRTMKLIRQDAGTGYHLEVEEIAELFRPPMIEIEEYQVNQNPLQAVEP